MLRQAFQARPLAGLAFELADTLILQGKFEGKEGAGHLMALLRRAGLGDTLVRFLEAEVLVRRKRWAEAIDELETARAILASAPDLSLRINLMLAECHGRMGSDDRRLDALRRAADGTHGGEAARLELVRALAESGRLDQAISVLAPMAVAGNNSEWRLDLVRLLLQKTVRQPRDRRNWPEVERSLREAEKATRGAKTSSVLLRLDVLAAQDRLDEARSLLARSLAREPRNLGYRLAMARVAQLQHRDDEAMGIIDRAEKDLGPSVRIDLARLDYWGWRAATPAGRRCPRWSATRDCDPSTRPAGLPGAARYGRDPARPPGAGAPILARAGGP